MYGGKRGMRTGFWWEDLREGDHLGDPGVDGKTILKWIFKKCHSGNQIEKNEMGGVCSTYGGKSGAYRILVGRPEARRPLGRPRRRWEDNIKMDLQEVGWGMDWIELAQYRDKWRVLLNAVMNLQVP
jgi:hypothetical protein